MSHALAPSKYCFRINHLQPPVTELVTYSLAVQREEPVPYVHSVIIMIIYLHLRLAVG